MSKPSRSNAVSIDVGQLPSAPHVLLKLIEACHKQDVSFEELASIIQMDAGLSARIIAVANSPAYAQWNDTKNFNRLLVVLGLNTIKTIAITSAVHQFFSQYTADLGRWMGQFWRASLGCAYSARLLAKLTGYPALDEAYLAGLLHRIGQLVLLKQRPDDYPTLLFADHSDQLLDDKERSLFGTTCSEVGAQVTHEWDPESFLSDALLYQREPATTLLDAPRLVKLVNFAHKLNAVNRDLPTLYAEADLLFGLSQPMVDELVRETGELVDTAAQGLGVQLDRAGGASVDNESVRLQLASRIREFALLDGVHQQLMDSEGTADILSSAMDGLKVLFGLGHSICFLYQSQQGLLQAAAGSDTASHLLEELQMPFKPGRSLVSEALIMHRVICSFDHDPPPLTSVLDAQLARLLSAEGIVSIPLSLQQHEIGVLVAGIDRADRPALQRQRDLLESFSAAVATDLRQQQRLESDQQEALRQQRERQQVHVRKLMHEVNNPLSIIKNYLQVLSIRLQDDQGVQDQLKILNEEIDRVGNILLRLDDVSPTVELPQRAVDINALIRDLITIFDSSLFSTHQINAKISLDAKLPLILINRNSLKQVLTNLIKNAVEALPEGGQIEVGSRDRVNVDGRQFVELRVADNGPGIQDEVLSSIFTPVKSSKGRGHAGLGLTIVKNLMTDLQGSISCRNRSSGGAEFVLLLPRQLES